MIYDRLIDRNLMLNPILEKKDGEDHPLTYRTIKLPGEPLNPYWKGSDSRGSR
jgi:hypothetical protein